MEDRGFSERESFISLNCRNRQSFLHWFSFSLFSHSRSNETDKRRDSIDNDSRREKFALKSSFPRLHSRFPFSWTHMFWMGWVNPKNWQKSSYFAMKIRHQNRRRRVEGGKLIISRPSCSIQTMNSLLSCMLYKGVHHAIFAFISLLIPV